METTHTETTTTKEKTMIEINHERYGQEAATFENLGEAEAAFHALGSEWAAVEFRIRGTRVIDQTGETVGRVIE